MSEQVANNDSNKVGAVLGNRTTGTESSNVEELQALERSILAMQADDQRNAGGRSPSPKRAGEREGGEAERSSKSPRSLEEGVVRPGGATGDVETRGAGMGPRPRAQWGDCGNVEFVGVVFDGEPAYGWNFGESGR